MVWAVADEADCVCAGFSILLETRSRPFVMERKRGSGDPRPEVQASSMDRRALLIELRLGEVALAFPLLGPVFQECYRLRDHSLAMTLVTVVAKE